MVVVPVPRWGRESVLGISDVRCRVGVLGLVTGYGEELEVGEFDRKLYCAVQ